MAITQAQADKNWQDSPSTTTPILAADLKALSKRDRSLVSMIPASVTSIDEFDDDTLDPAWVRVDSASTPAVNATWAEGGDVLSVAQLGGDAANNIRGLMRPLGGAIAVGDGFVAALRVFGPPTNFTMGGIVLSDGVTAGSGNQAVGLIYQTGSVITYNAWTGTGWNLSGSTTDTQVPGGPHLIFLRFACITANTWRTDASPDGVSWVKGNSTLARTITPTHVGVLSSSWGSATKGVVSYECLRRVSGVS